ncbi:MAG: MFS transporter [Propionibacteriaceae bacterium]|nr:MFS transporter [Propionibacteriaceae bacterium]
MTNAPPTAEFEFARIKWIYFGLMIGMFTASISQTIIGPAIPRIVADLGGLPYYAWLSTIVMLVSAIVTPVSGKLADMFGRRRFYILGLLVFMGGSVLSGLAMNFPFLVFARAVQGVGMGVLMPLSQTILGDVIPPRQRGKYQGYMGAMMGASQVAGPLIGGAITDASSWRWLFYINLPVGLIALFMIIRFLHVPELSIPRTVDHAGIATMTLGVTATLLGITFGGTRGWTDPMVAILVIVGLAFLVAFVLIERRAAEPIVPMHLFRNSIFTWSVIASFFLNMALIVLLIYTPVYAQGVLGVSATASGLILMPMNLAVFGIGIVIGILTTRTGRYKMFAVAGTTVVLASAVLLLGLDAESTPLELTAITFVFGLGIGMSFQIYTLAVQNAVQRRDLGPATASLQFFRNIGNTIATAVAGTMMTQQLLTGIQTHMTPEAVAVTPAEGIDPNLVLNPSQLASLPAPLVEVLHRALADAMHSVYLLLPGIAAIALVATLMVRAIPLRDSLSTPEAAARSILDSTALSSVNPDMMLLTPREFHLRSKERLLAAHLLLLAEQVEQPGNALLRAAVTDFGDGDLTRGLQLLRSSGTMLLSEDPHVIDEHEGYAVELSERGKRRDMLSDEVTLRLHEVASRVVERPRGEPTKPHLPSVEGIDEAALHRAVGLLNTALVADVASRRWALEAETDDEPDAGATAAEDAE